jgi:methionine synthase II (cobalamin-independent)
VEEPLAPFGVARHCVWAVAGRDHARMEVESIEVLTRRTEKAGRFVDLDRLAIRPQCGFASTAAGNPLTEEDERAKLALAVLK